MRLIRRICIDWMIGWHSGQGKHHADKAARHASEEARWKARHRELFPPVWR